jgi:DNA-directed RNA polymerase specialized sigma24 family protein
MDWVRHGASRREFDGFAAQAWDPLLRAGYLMTGDAKDAEDLVQETLLKVARRWNRVRAMDHPAAYVRRILVNLVLHDAGRRSRQRTELWPQDGGPKPPTRARHGLCERSMTRPSSAGR